MKRYYDKLLVGLEDDADNVLVPPIYHYIWMPENGYALVNNFCFYGLVRVSDGKEIVPVKYSHIDVKGDFVIVRHMDKYGIYKIDGTLLSEPVFSSPDIIPVFASVKQGSAMVTVYP